MRGEDFGDLASVRSMRTGRTTIPVGFDTEFTTVGDRRVIASYQLAVPDPRDAAVMVEIVILPLSAARLRLSTALQVVWQEAALWLHPLVAKKNIDERGVPRSEFWGDDDTGDAWKARENRLYKRGIPITLVSHYGSADLTTFAEGRYVSDHVVLLTSAAGGLVTLQPMRVKHRDVFGRWFLPFSVSVVDTMGHAPAGKKKLGDLGAACGVEKLDVPDGWISRMHEYRREHLADFLAYGINDSVICVEYAARLYGEGAQPPLTLSGGAVSAVRSSALAYWESAGLGVDESEFKTVFGGLVKEDQGVGVIEEEDRLSYYKKRGLEPLDGAAAQLQAAFARSYHGGLNTCPSVGFFVGRTLDVDAQNAYPTAMAAVVDVDFEGGCIRAVWHERVLTIADIPTPMTPAAAFVEFEFPDDVAFPCIPIVADGTLIYPRSSAGTRGTWVAAPELYLALRLGATVRCQIGYVGRTLTLPDGSLSRVLRHGVKQLIDDRNSAKRIYGKGSLEELTLKTAVNSIYGKTAQDISEHSAWQAKEQEMDSVGGSALTSPYHASMTTSMVRAQLHAVANQLHDAGHRVHSITTDGFITDAELTSIESSEGRAVMGMYGLADVLAGARAALTGDRSIWEAKHEQEELLCFTTRGNTAPTLGGVNAHNGYKLPRNMVHDSLEDRALMRDLVISRDSRIPNAYRRFPSFQELSRKENRKDFVRTRVDREISMDYDLKRKPVMASMTAVMVAGSDGTEHEVATFDTEPWPTVADALKAREIAKRMAQDGGCLRTVAQWREWDVRFRTGISTKRTSLSRRILMSIVIGHRQGVDEIQALTTDATLTERLNWLALWGLGEVSRSDWKNARRPERLSSMLPVTDLDPYLSAMRNCAYGPGELTEEIVAELLNT